MHIKKRTFIRLIAFSVAVFLSLFGYILKLSGNVKNYEEQIANRYNSALIDLSDYLSEIDTVLQKELYTNTAASLCSLSAECARLSGAAKECLAQLPVSADYTDGIYRYLSQVGNYSLSLAKKVSTGGELDDNDYNNLESLKEYSSNLTEAIDGLQTDMDNNDNWLGEIRTDVESIEDAANSTLNSGAEDVSQSVQTYGELIYDGPFSDHIDAQTPAYLENSSPVSVDTAKRIAAEILDTDINEITHNGDEQSSMPSYLFTSGEGYCAITKSGGYCLYANIRQSADEQDVTAEKAVKIAKSYAKELYKCDFSESYYIIDEGICTVNLAREIDGVTVYSQLVKVGVSLDDGDIASIEARGFLMHHKNREIKTAAHTADEAKAKISDKLTVNSQSRVIILSDGNYEYDCYEFACTKDGQDILVYINTETLAEEKILIIQHVEGGTLTR
ncbi:MAG: germination protein YpeB [Clostridia bacterium]|nr:germination protein YpeB [Clostridia bacterium]MEE1025058.1 germination protein YpeB [Acutalibacteraceae bacterium]